MYYVTYLGGALGLENMVRPKGDTRRSLQRSGAAPGTPPPPPPVSLKRDAFYPAIRIDITVVKSVVIINGFLKIPIATRRVLRTYSHPSTDERRCRRIRDVHILPFIGASCGHRDRPSGFSAQTVPGHTSGVTTPCRRRTLYFIIISLKH